MNQPSPGIGWNMMFVSTWNPALQLEIPIPPQGSLMAPMGFPSETSGASAVWAPKKVGCFLGVHSVGYYLGWMIFGCFKLQLP